MLMLGTLGMYHDVPFSPMVHEDRMDSKISMLRFWYTVGCTVLYHLGLIEQHRQRHRE